MVVFEKVGGVMVIIVDYGNCEMMYDFEIKGLYIVYMLNFVYVVVVGGFVGVILCNGCLVDFVLMVLDLMGLELLFEMIGKSLIVE